MNQRRLAEAREKAELRGCAPVAEQALARGLGLIAFAAALRGFTRPAHDVSPEDLRAYSRWARVRTALRDQ
ncbi:MAG: hypothetical protein MJD61_02155 [Proteobacteria bacterium]|nr:hypothetical protein [Pseudomonadota bacterium]